MEVVIFIPMGVMYLHARTFCTYSDTILYPLRAPMFTVITEVWPRANRAVVRNNLTVIIEVVLIKGFLYTIVSRSLTNHNASQLSRVNQGFPVYNSLQVTHKSQCIQIKLC